jgi:hypothetical protein
MASAKEAAAYIDVDLFEFSLLLDRGIVKSRLDGNFDLGEVLHQYLRHLRRVVAGIEAPTPSISALEEEPDGKRN